MELSTTNRGILELNEGVDLILGIEDLDVLFSWRLSGILVTLEPKLKKYNATKKKLDKEYGEDKKDDKGKVTGQAVPPSKVNEWLEKIETLQEAGVNFDSIGSIKLSELRKMSEEEGILLSGKMIHLIRVVVVEDINPDDGKKKEEEKSEEKETRASRRAKAKEDEKEEDK